MSKPTVSAAGGAMPAEGHKTRRAALGFLARSTARVSALACLPAVAMAASPTGDDAEILALSAEVLRRVNQLFSDQALAPFEVPVLVTHLLGGQRPELPLDVVEVRLQFGHGTR